MRKLKLGITIGDVNGIGPEVIIRTLNDKRISDRFIPIIYGSSKVISYYRNVVEAKEFNTSYFEGFQKMYPGKIYVKNCWENKVDINIGKPTEDGGKFAQFALLEAVKDAKAGNLDGIITAPINKHAMQLSGFKFPGHTEYFADAFEIKESLMMMVSDSLKVALVTNHLPVKDIPTHLTKEKIKTKLKLLIKTLQVDFGIDKPNIAILGLNPHAGDNGTIGNEEIDIIRPVIVEAKHNNIVVSGPYPADGFFGSGQFKKFDAILAMYHDQGLIPFKTLSFGNGVNFTAGLPIVRTSPDHGTAYDLVGTGTADISSFRNAIFLALDVARNNRDYAEMNKDPLRKKPKLTEHS